ncbi:hypothetical protein CRV24_005843 [Beauveria bassiana]|nr:hypothetical protein CRV24_005843 [Beauveria bassiana]KAH8709192.1 hypothetical protein HC256_009115 [Beauveria bassiana]
MAGAIDPSERLALQLMQDDLEEFKPLQKGKGRADEPDDFALALQMQSFPSATPSHFLHLSQNNLFLPQQSSLARLDKVALLPKLTRSFLAQSGNRTLQTQLVRFAKRPYRLCASLVDDEASGSTVTNDSTPVDEDQDLICVACDGAYGENLAVSVSCGHVYCRDCLACLFKASTTDESLFPPRCCKEPISLDDVEKWLPKELLIEFEDKEDEFTSADRTYCSNVNCSKFISPYHIHDGLGYCEACDVWTCTFCKGAEHDGACPDDPYKKEILAVAKENGWQQCYRCQHLVELNHGCNHIKLYVCLSLRE